VSDVLLELYADRCVCVCVFGWRLLPRLRLLCGLLLCLGLLVGSLAGFLSILYSIGSKPLSLWEKKVRGIPLGC
jgi:hypothetical protein